MPTAHSHTTTDGGSFCSGAFARLTETFAQCDDLFEICIHFRAKGFEPRRMPLGLLSCPHSGNRRTLAEANHLDYISVQEIELCAQIRFHRWPSSTGAGAFCGFEAISREFGFAHTRTSFIVGGSVFAMA
jgi:hypothetical protein